MSEFALHVRAFTGMPIGKITQYGACASAAILGQGTSQNLAFCGLEDALSLPQTQIRLFAKPEINGRRRLGVALARGKDTQQAVDKAIDCAKAVKIEY